MKKNLFIIILGFSFFNSNAQIHYSDKKVEGYILNAAIYKNKEYLDPTVKDVQCFEASLKQKNGGNYAGFYRQYSAKIIKGRKTLIVDMFKKTYFKDVSELSKPFSVIDGCEDVRHIAFDIETKKIIHDQNGGGCDS